MRGGVIALVFLGLAQWLHSHTIYVLVVFHYASKMKKLIVFSTQALITLASVFSCWMSITWYAELKGEAITFAAILFGLLLDGGKLMMTAYGSKLFRMRRFHLETLIVCGTMLVAQGFSAFCSTAYLVESEAEKSQQYAESKEYYNQALKTISGKRQLMLNKLSEAKELQSRSRKTKASIALEEANAISTQIDEMATELPVVSRPPTLSRIMELLGLSVRTIYLYLLFSLILELVPCIGMSYLHELKLESATGREKYTTTNKGRNLVTKKDDQSLVDRVSSALRRGEVEPNYESFRAFLKCSQSKVKRLFELLKSQRVLIQLDNGRYILAPQRTSFKLSLLWWRRKKATNMTQNDQDKESAHAPISVQTNS